MIHNLGITDKELFPLMVTYLVEPALEDFARNNGININWSYEI